MSGSIRDMFVGIHFNDEASKVIDKVDKSMDGVEDTAKGFGRQLGLVENNIDSFGTAGIKAADDIGQGMNKASDNVIDLSNYMNRAGRAGIDAGNDISSGSKKAANALNDVEKAAKDTAAETDKAGDSTDNTSNKFTNLQTIGVGAWTAIGSAIAGATAGIAALVAEQDAAMSRLEAKTGLAGSELAGIQDTVKNVFNAGIGTDLTTVSDDVVRIKNSLKGLDGKELESFSKQAITISDLWGEGSENVVWAVKNMTSNFEGLTEQKALDLITVGFQKTGDYAGDLLDTFKEYSPYFSKMGLNAEDFTKILISGAENGAWNLDKVGDAVKEFGISAIDGSKTTSSAFKDLGLDADHMASQIAKGGESANQAFYATIAGLAAIDDEVKRNEVGVSLFKTQWEDVREDVILAMGDAKNSVLDFEGAAERATTTASDNVGTKLTSAWRGFRSEMAGIFQSSEGSAMVDGIVTGFTTALGIAKDFSGFIVNNWGTVSNVVVGLGTTVGSFTLIMGGLKVIGVINTLMAAYRAGTLVATAAQMGLNVAMLASPVTWVVAGIAALVGIGVVLWKNWDTVKQKAGELWQKLLDNPLLALAAGPFGALVTVGITLYKNFDKIKASFGAFKNAISNFKLPKWVTSIGETISGATSKVKGWFSGDKTDGSHATGLASVPFDGYRAELHKNEAVLTAQQSNALRSAGILRENSDGTPNLSIEPKQPEPSGNPFPDGNGPQNSGVQISVPLSFTINGNSTDAEKIKNMIISRVPSIVREVVSDILDSELQTL